MRPEDARRQAVHNTSVLPDDLTAHTDPECAAQRAEHLAILGVESVLELCAGPSLKTLEMAYAFHGIQVTGNDIDPRWRDLYPLGSWVIDDALTINPRPFDAVVFAPPLSRGCTGRRSDALMIDEVEPGYTRFLWCLGVWGYTGVGVLVLPARALATGPDREQLYRLLSLLPSHELIPLVAGPRRIRKYVDVYFDA